MPKFRKKPVVIDATQWKIGDAPLPCMRPYGESIKDQFPAYEGHYFIETLEGIHHVSDGDWVITGIKGEHYPCKADIFDATYEQEIVKSSLLVPHEQRVLDEKVELDEKIAALQKFIAKSLLFEELALAERWRLTTQCHLMVQYSAILGERIEEFSPE